MVMLSTPGDNLVYLTKETPHMKARCAICELWLQLVFLALKQTCPLPFHQGWTSELDLGSDTFQQTQSHHLIVLQSSRLHEKATDVQ